MTKSFVVEGVAVPADHYIGGKRVTSDSTFEVRSPMDWNLLLGHVARGDRKTADLAVSAATKAFPAWAALSPNERGAHLHRLADLIDENKDDLAIVECF